MIAILTLVSFQTMQQSILGLIFISWIADIVKQYIAMLSYQY